MKLWHKKMHFVERQISFKLASSRSAVVEPSTLDPKIKGLIPPTHGTGLSPFLTIRQFNQIMANIFACLPDVSQVE